MNTPTGLFNTTGELQEFLSTFPADTPLTVTYDGTGRVHAVASYDGGDNPVYVAVFPATDAWLTGNAQPLDNPLVSS